MFRTFEKFVEEYEYTLDPRLVKLLMSKDTCECGSDLMINEEKTIILCSNAECPFKVSKRLQQMCKDLLIMGIGETLAQKIVEHLGLSSPIQLLAYVPEEDGVLADSISIERCNDFYNQIKSKEYQLWEYLRSANIPSVRDNSVKIMKGVESFTELYEQLDVGGIGFIEDQLGLNRKEENSIMATQIYEGLMNEKPYLLHVEPYLNVPDKTDEITVVISKGINNYPSKEAFINMINARYKGLVYVNYIKTMSSNVNVLIWEGVGEYTSKVQKAEKLGVPIMTSMEFIDYIDSKY